METEQFEALMMYVLVEMCIRDSFYPDRRGQIEGQIDPLIAGANAIGILFYVIPGLIAFAVDFATGAIYLPQGQTAQVDPQQLKQLIGEDGKVDQYALKALIESSTGHQLPLDDPRLIQHLSLIHIYVRHPGRGASGGAAW